MPDTTSTDGALAFRTLPEDPALGAASDGPAPFGQSGLPVAEDGPSQLAVSFAAELAALREQARAEGFAAGHAAGLADARAQVAAAVEQARAKAEASLDAERAQAARAAQALTAAAAQVEQVFAPTASEMTHTMSVSAFALAEQIIGRDLDAATSMAADAVERALRLCPADAPVTVRVHPEDLAAVQTWTEVPDTVTLVPDPAMTPGGAVAVFGATQVDARLDAALARAKAVLSA